jgi:CNT family concentrative nucleoside transporter
MHRKLLLLSLFLFYTIGLFAQEMEKKWQLKTSESDYLELKEGRYVLNISSDSITQKGDYLIQENFLFLFENGADAPTKRFTITNKSDSILALQTKDKAYSFFASNKTIKNPNQVALIASEGFSVKSLWKGILGMISLLLLAYFFSSNKKEINWKTVGIGILVQLILAIGVLKVGFVQYFFDIVGRIFTEILDFTRAGSVFLLGGMMDVSSFGFIFLFQVLPTIIFFSSLTSLLFYIGVIQIVVKGMALVLTKLLNVSGAESLSVAGNIFLGQTEAPLLIKAYLEKMNKSEILLVMVGGMATVAGGVLAAYIGFLGGGDKTMEAFYARHLLAASVMAAPGAIVISKMLFPQTEVINTDVTVSKEKIGSNMLDSIATGTSEGLKLAANVAAMLLVFIAFIAMINFVLGDLIGEYTGLNQLVTQHTPYNKFSLETILGILFAPLMWLIGVAKEDVMLMGQLLGIKLAASEFVGYIQLAELKNAASSIHFTYNKSVIMATYMLCGFANFASIGIQIGGIGSLAPGQRKTLSEFGLKAVIGGSIASLLSATIAGMIIG